MRLLRKKPSAAALLPVLQRPEPAAHLDELAELGVSHVTVTINAVDPDVGVRFYALGARTATWSSVESGARLR